MSDLTITFDSATAISKGVRVLMVHRPLAPIINHHTETIPGRPGTYLFPQSVGARIITVDMGINEATMALYADRLHTVADWLYTTTRTQLIISDQTDRYWSAVALPGGEITLESTLSLASFSVPFECEPYAYSVATNTESWSTNTTNPESLTNAGNALAYPILTATIRAGGATNPSLTAGGNTITYTGVLAAADILIFNSETLTVTKNGVNAMTNISGDFPALNPGANDVTWTATAGHADIAATWHDRWL